MFYLGSGSKRASSGNLIEAAADVDEIPIAKLELASGLLDIPAPKGLFGHVCTPGPTACG